MMGGRGLRLCLPLLLTALLPVAGCTVRVPLREGLQVGAASTSAPRASWRGILMLEPDLRELTILQRPGGWVGSGRKFVIPVGRSLTAVLGEATYALFPLVINNPDTWPELSRPRDLLIRVRLLRHEEEVDTTWRGRLFASFRLAVQVEVEGRSGVVAHETLEARGQVRSEPSPGEVHRELAAAYDQAIQGIAAQYLAFLQRVLARQDARAR